MRGVDISKRSSSEEPRPPAEDQKTDHQSVIWFLVDCVPLLQNHPPGMPPLRRMLLDRLAGRHKIVGQLKTAAVQVNLKKMPTSRGILLLPKVAHVCPPVHRLPPAPEDTRVTSWNSMPITVYGGVVNTPPRSTCSNCRENADDTHTNYC
jgi:hypothetical protein